jgi:hypothetical protein
MKVGEVAVAMDLSESQNSPLPTRVTLAHPSKKASMSRSSQAVAAQDNSLYMGSREAP